VRPRGGVRDGIEERTNGTAVELEAGGSGRAGDVEERGHDVDGVAERVVDVLVTT
jgi:hypothetical protein